MSASSQALEEIQALLRSERYRQAWELADRLVQRDRADVSAWLGRAYASLGLGRWHDADVDSRAAERLSPRDPYVRMARGLAHYRLGRMDESARILRGLVEEEAPNRLEAAVALAETLHRAAQDGPLEALLQSPGPWNDDPRVTIHRARFLARRDPAEAIRQLERTARSAPAVATRRSAGFEAVRLLDRAGRHREAWALATEIHQATTPPFDLGGMLEGVREQAKALSSRRRWFRPKVSPVQGLATVVALPRSGTTLLEQMLDAHPSIAGIGEYEGVKSVGEGLLATGRWPWELDEVPEADAMALQRAYVAGATAQRRSGATWSFDKTLHAWRWLPAIAAVLPGTVCFHMVRDPRDMAVSLFLSNFHRRYNGWTADLGSIRRVIEAERSILPEALGTLGLPHECLVYEDLVADPQGHAKRCLDRLGLPMSDAVLRPEANRRSVLTLSHEQVRNPINAGSIGRWRNYAWAFDGAWDALAEAHDARRRHR